jgi:hypothetical protein
MKWLQSFASPVSGFRNSQVMGISEYFRLEVPASDAKGGIGFEDYLYETTSSVDARWGGGPWGFIRAYDGIRPDLLPLPNNPDGKVKDNPDRRQMRGACPRSAPSRKFSILAVEAADVLPDGRIEYNPAPLFDPTGLMYVMKADLDKQTGQLKAGRRVEPLILRAAAGDCITVTLTNQLSASLHGPDPAFPTTTEDLAGFNMMPMVIEGFNANQVRPSSHVGLHPQLVNYDMGKDGDGMNVGFNPPSTAGPGGIVKYKWYAGNVQADSETGVRTVTPIEFGAVNLAGADPIKHSSKGLVAALIIEPEGATWAEDGEVGTDGLLTRAAVTVEHPGGSFRDFVIIMQDDLNLRLPDGSPVPIVSEEEDSEDSGMKAINYRTDPVWLRLGIGPTADAEITRLVDFTDAFAGDPVTPIFTAEKGEDVRFRVLKPGGHNRAHVFALHGHLWPRHPFNADSTEIDVANLKTFWHGEQMGHGPTNHVNVVPLNGAGGLNGVEGDYLYRDMTPVHAYNGIWGVFRVE